MNNSPAAAGAATTSTFFTHCRGLAVLSSPAHNPAGNPSVVSPRASGTCGSRGGSNRAVDATRRT
ncbi:hypothetical protein [Streptomyces antnestii]|uniref:hypothetical protein n=1 Tax=Streptomyces antnestii TaxID=2494256 RepID=UPI001CB9906E|nr:hypothetical protein [Streptomyces sp. San01]